MVTKELIPGVLRTCLPDGTAILSEEMSSVRSVAAGLWFRQGTAHEQQPLRGISHMLEHMVFKGTTTRSARQLALEVERLGGALDAYTSHEHTAFQARVLDRHLDVAMDVLCDLAFRPTLRESDLQLEREVVLEEITRVEDTPDDLVFELHADLLFGEHPYGAPILGTKESVKRISTEDLRALHEATYRSGNLIVAAAGRLDHDALVEMVLERLPEGSVQAPESPNTPVQHSVGPTRVQREGSRQTHIVAGGLGLPYGHHLRLALVLISSALGGGMSSRLFQRIREERGLAYSVFSFQAFYTAGGHVGAYVGTREETAPDAREALLEELRNVAETGLQPDELDGAKEELKGQLMLSLESPASRMNRLAGLALYDEPFRTLDEVAERIDRVSADEINEAAALLHPDGLAVLELSPA